MFTRPLASTSVCFRCRLRLILSSQNTRHLSTLSISPSLKRRRPIPNTSRILDTRYFATESTAPAYDQEHLQQEKEKADGQGQGQGQDQGQTQTENLFKINHAVAEHESEWGTPRDENRKPAPAKRPSISRGKGKIHRAGRRVLTEASENLGTEMLGKPARAIVMREGVYERKQLETVILDGDPTPTSIEALLISQNQPITPEQVRANIDELRPTTETSLPEKEFRKLQHTLTEGFLKTQLKDYIENYTKHGETRSTTSITSTKASRDGIDGATKPYEWIRSITPWVPLNDDSTIIEGAHRNLHGYLPESATEKEKLAVRILRECWRLSIQELSFVLGETRVILRNYDFILLMRGTRRFMNQLVWTWLDPGEKIEAFRKQKMLRLITTKPKVEIVLKDLHETLACVTTQTVPLAIISSEPIDDALLEEVGRITNAHIRRSHTLKRLHVTWIEARQDGRGLEDLRHIVFRLLWTALAPVRASTALYAEFPTDRTSGQLIVDKTNREKWGWKDKMGEWARYVLPLATSESELSGQDTNSNVMTEEVGMPLRELPLPIASSSSEPDESQDISPQDPSPSLAQRVKWAKNIKTTTKAHFGHILHSRQPSAPPLPQHLPDLLATAHHHPRIFSPITPHPLHLAKLESPTTTGGSVESYSSPLVQTKSTIVIRFWPSPNPNPGEGEMPPKPIVSEHQGRGNSRKASQRKGARNDSKPQVLLSPTSAPILELCLAATDTEIRGVESLRAIVDSRVSDAMLPSSPVDLRVTQTRHVDVLPLVDDAADAADALANWQPISDFLSMARLDLARGKLEMPPRQRFPVPRRLFRDFLSQEGDKSRGKRKDDEREDLVLSTSYEFVGLELHSSASIPYDDGRHMLTYTSIEAGQGGGRRAEVTLEPVLEGVRSLGHRNGVDVDVEGLQKGFLACCYAFAKSDALWSGYLVNQQRKAS